jgi:hypothetical protein
MSTTSATSFTNRNSLLRSIALGGISVGVLHLIIQEWLVFGLIYKNPFISVLQYFASGALGNAAFGGGLASALLGLLFHFVISFVIAAVFILSAERIPLLRRYIIIGSLLYGIGVFIVMNFIVLPLSAAPTLPPPTLFQLIELIIEHVLVIGLPLGILVQRSATSNK